MEKEQIREIIAKRVAMELKDGDVVNLGIGLPTAVPDYLPEGVQIFLQSENGLLGMGPTPAPGEEDPEFINAGGGFVTALEGASCFDSATSFGIIRGGHVKITPEGIVLTEINPEFTVEQVQAATEAHLIVSKDLKPMKK